MREVPPFLFFRLNGSVSAHYIFHYFIQQNKEEEEEEEKLS